MAPGEHGLFIRPPETPTSRFDRRRPVPYQDHDVGIWKQGGSGGDPFGRGRTEQQAAIAEWPLLLGARVGEPQQGRADMRCQAGCSAQVLEPPIVPAFCDRSAKIQQCLTVSKEEIFRKPGLPTLWM